MPYKLFLIIDQLFFVFIGLLVAGAVAIAYAYRPFCPKCKTKMREMQPHGDQEVYKCSQCDREWIQL